jgi:hypothetical protein
LKEELIEELQRRFWVLYDISKIMTDNEPTPEIWAAFYRAVADIPESQRP